MGVQDCEPIMSCERLRKFLKSKLSWTLFEKGLLAVVVAGAVWFFQYRVEILEKKIDQSRAAARVQTDILVDQRRKLIDAMTEYFLLIDSLLPAGQAIGKDAKELGRLRERVDMALFNVAAMDPGITKPGGDLVDSIRDCNDFLIQELHVPYVIRKNATGVRDKYKTLLDYLSTSTRVIATKEYEAAGR
jgi:hypothetical protein